MPLPSLRDRVRGAPILQICTIISALFIILTLFFREPPAVIGATTAVTGLNLDTNTTRPAEVVHRHKQLVNKLADAGIGPRWVPDIVVALEDLDINTPEDLKYLEAATIEALDLPKPTKKKLYSLIQHTRSSDSPLAVTSATTPTATLLETTPAPMSPAPTSAPVESFSHPACLLPSGQPLSKFPSVLIVGDGFHTSLLAERLVSLKVTKVKFWPLSLSSEVDTGSLWAFVAASNPSLVLFSFLIPTRERVTEFLSLCPYADSSTDSALFWINGLEYHAAVGSEAPSVSDLLPPSMQSVDVSPAIDALHAAPADVTPQCVVHTFLEHLLSKLDTVSPSVAPPQHPTVTEADEPKWVDWYTSLHRQMVSPQSTTTRFLVFEMPEQDSKAHMGDALMGLSSALVVAMASNRALLVDWKDTSVWRDHIHSWFINFDVKAPAKAFPTAFDSPAEWSTGNASYTEIFCDAHVDLDQVFTQDTLVFAANLPFWTHFLELPQYSTFATKWNLGLAGASPTVIQKFLWQPVPRLADEIERIRTVHFPRDSFVLGVQIEIGIAPASITNHSRFGDLFGDRSAIALTGSPEETHALFASLREQLLPSLLTQGRRVKLYVSSTSDSVIARFKEEFGEQVLTASDLIIHKKDADEADPDVNFDTMVVDHWLLGDCDALIVTPFSSYGATAVVRKHPGAWAFTGVNLVYAEAMDLYDVVGHRSSLTPPPTKLCVDEAARSQCTAIDQLTKGQWKKGPKWVPDECDLGHHVEALAPFPLLVIVANNDYYCSYLADYLLNLKVVPTFIVQYLHFPLPNGDATDLRVIRETLEDTQPAIIVFAFALMGGNWQQRVSQLVSGVPMTQTVPTYWFHGIDYAPAGKPGMTMSTATAMASEASAALASTSVNFLNVLPLHEAAGVPSSLLVVEPPVVDAYVDILMAAVNIKNPPPSPVVAFQPEGFHWSTSWYEWYQDLHRRIMDAADPTPKRFIIYAVPERADIGGIGNRLDGLLSVLLIALVTERAFLIDWENPSPYKNHLRSDYINLEYKAARATFPDLFEPESDEGTDRRYMRGDRAPRPRIAYFHGQNTMHEDVCCHDNDLDKMWPEPVVSVVSNRPQWKGLIENPRYADKFAKWGLGVDKGTMASLQQFIWTPLPHIAREIERYKAQHFTPDVFVVGVQIRIGLKFQNRFQDGEFIFIDPPNEFHKIFDALEMRILPTLKTDGRPVKFFLTADSDLSINMFKERYGDRVFTTEGEITHSGVGLENNELKVGGFDKVVMDNWLLGECDELFITLHSSYGLTAANRVNRGAWVITQCDVVYEDAVYLYDLLDDIANRQWLRIPTGPICRPEDAGRRVPGIPLVLSQMGANWASWKDTWRPVRAKLKAELAAEKKAHSP